MSSSSSSQPQANSDSSIKFYNYHEYFLHPRSFLNHLDYLERPRKYESSLNTYLKETLLQTDNKQNTLNVKQLSIPSPPPQNQNQNQNEYYNNRDSSKTMFNESATISDKINETINPNYEKFNNEMNNSESSYSNQKIQGKDLTIPNKPVLMCHFPNSYYPSTSAHFKQTRIVRIPREFQKYGDIVPQFSTYYPGEEPGALKSQTSKKQEQERKAKKNIKRHDEVKPTLVEKHNNTNGMKEERDADVDTDTEAEIEQSPVDFMLPIESPLHPYLTELQFQEIVTTVNQYLKDAYWPYNPWNILDVLAGYLTCWIFPYILKMLIILYLSFFKSPVKNNRTTDQPAIISNNNNNDSSSENHNRRLKQVSSTLLGFSHTNRQLQKLEKYIINVNKELNKGGQEETRKIKIISPLRSAYLSLDIEIPTPVPGEQYVE